MLFLGFCCKCVSFLSPPSMCHMWNMTHMTIIDIWLSYVSYSAWYNAQKAKAKFCLIWGGHICWLSHILDISFLMIWTTSLNLEDSNKVASYSNNDFLPSGGNFWPLTGEYQRFLTLKRLIFFTIRWDSCNYNTESWFLYVVR